MEKNYNNLFDNFSDYTDELNDFQLYKDMYENMQHLYTVETFSTSEIIESIELCNRGIKLNWRHIAKTLKKSGCILIENFNEELLVSIFSDKFGEKVFKIETKFINL